MSDLFANIKKSADFLPTKHATMFSDGGSRGNPGTAGAGAVIFDEDKNIIWQGGRYCGTNTNNFAEYHGVLLGLEQALKHKITHLKVYLDSNLIVEQMNGNWKVKNINIKPLFEQAKKSAENFVELSFHHVPREQNKIADQLANKAMDLQSDF